MSSEKRDASPEASPLKGPAPKAIPEDTSDVTFEDGIPLSPMAGDQSVQFISGAPANGDAKVEIGDSGGTAPTFVGLGKEELMKYANDPFWVKLRWFLFILFWVLWLAMLVGAIVIIVLAPRCSEKKTPVETFFQTSAAKLIKDSKIDENTKALSDLGIKSIIIADVLQHQLDEPEAVTDFKAFSEDLSQGLLTQAINELRKQGIKILLKIIPNHSGTSHEWFNETSNDNSKYVRRPFDEVKNSVWVRQDNASNAWTRDTRPGLDNTAYLQLFPGNVADLNFENDENIDSFKDIFKYWKTNSIDGFIIGKASFLLENLEDLMSLSATKNQPGNPKLLSKLVKPSSEMPVLVELEDASDETINEYVNLGMTPILKSKIVNSEQIRQMLEVLSRNSKAVIDLSASPQKAPLINLLASALGSHSLVSDGISSDGNKILKTVVEFQEKYPRGKAAQFRCTTANNIVATLRSDGDDLLAVANFGSTPMSFDPTTALNITVNKGKVVLSTSDSPTVNAETDGAITVNGNSGVIILYEKPQTHE